jgi:hypothetical protein
MDSFTVFLAIAVGAVILALSSRSRASGAWRAAADVLGATYSKGGALSGPKISGTIDGMDLTVSVRSSGNMRVTRYEVRYRSAGIGLQVQRKTGLSKLTEYLGAQDAKTGDATFDEVMMVKTADPDRIGTVLTPPVRQAILDLMETCPKARVSDDHVVFEHPNVDRNVDTIARTAQGLLRVASALTGGSAQQPPIEPPLEATYWPMPPPEPAMPPMEPPPESTVESMRPTAGPSTTRGIGSSQSTRSSTTRGSGRVESTRSSTGSGSEMLPDAMQPDESTRPTADQPTMEPTGPATSYEMLPPDPYSAASMQEAPMYVEPSPPTQMEPAPAVATPQRPAEPPVGPRDVASALFGGHHLSFEMAELFQQRFAGREVAWNGTVKTRTEQAISVDVGTVDTDLFGPVTILVMVTPATGSAQPGDPVIVNGVLTSVDAFERTIGVDGTVERL